MAVLERQVMSMSEMLASSEERANRAEDRADALEAAMVAPNTGDPVRKETKSSKKK